MTGPSSCMSTSTKQLPLSQLDIAAYAEEAVNKKNLQCSRFFTDHTAEYPKFEWNELIIGKLLGKGGYETAYEVRGIAVNENNGTKLHKSRQPTRSFWFRKADDSTNESEADEPSSSSRQFIEEHCLYHGGASRYAVKKLRQDLSPANRLQGTIDMALEARLLSNISHPHIIQMRAVASTSPFFEGYFIVMDRLCDTLDKRLLQWEAMRRRWSGLSGAVLDHSHSKSAALYHERIVAASDLASAIAYLHEQKIIYRDIKPENIGFDMHGDIKLFDFGLAKELSLAQMNNDGTYLLTEWTGSPFHMSPEVANGKPYNESCDVYSFAILLWEIMALKRPFALYTPQGMRSKVYNGAHKRPPITEDIVVSWPDSIIQTCLLLSWDRDLHARPPMSKVFAFLHKECVLVADSIAASALAACRAHYHDNRPPTLLQQEQSPS